MLLEKSVQALGHAVVTAASVSLAWKVLDAEPADVVITDWVMPGASGLDLTRGIRAQTRPKYTYIIIVTQYTERAQYLEGMDAGADDFLSKPIDMVQLFVRLRVAERIVALQGEVAQLQGLIPICMDCRKVRTRVDDWDKLETYVEHHSDARFSHGLCPDCFERRRHSMDLGKRE
jgi:DNA-binding response OmpR family regulator